MTSITRAERRVPYAFVGIPTLTIAVAAATTTAWWRAMSATRGIAMPGGWRMSMTWLPMHGGTWVGAAAAFVTMWVVMMVPMMLPSLAPSLWQYRERIVRNSSDDIPPRDRAAMASVSCLVAGVGYLAVWAALGALLFPVGALLATILLRAPSVARAAPKLAAVIVLASGALQFTRWKAARLESCRVTMPRDRSSRQTIVAAVGHGVQLGLACCRSCANWMLILLVIGVMDPVPMLAVTGAISAERLSGGGSHIRIATGLAALVAGGILLASGRFPS